MAGVKDKARITANGDYEVKGLIQGRVYMIGLFYEGGTGSMAIKESVDGGTAQAFFESGSAVSVTTTKPFQVVQLAGDAIEFTISSASSLNAILRCFPIPHGYTACNR
jgi:hypothetical protein